MGRVGRMIGRLRYVGATRLCRTEVSPLGARAKGSTDTITAKPLVGTGRTFTDPLFATNTRVDCSTVGYINPRRIIRSYGRSGHVVKNNRKERLSSND